jgi:hypothetical protein
MDMPCRARERRKLKAHQFRERAAERQVIRLTKEREGG